ncbi:hypothetical protein QR680_009906 [Steinernema hermaphroditum]|uniref:7TM GPCR serpentine receptor class x (Srx) domain-containing protein n=1 Tax=Steinernema hermaphroditum TaxID=289476 RepID=A0AA39MAT1_9BILA|nr:hypothetical protein QR680_009906 [Steinernema hermaphroditum]
MVSDVERLVLGCLYLAISVSFIAIQAFSLYIIASRKEFRQQTAYIIMFHAGLFDCTILISGLNASAMTLTNSKFIVAIEQFFAGVQDSSWMTTIVIDLLLALNRLDVVTVSLNVPTATKERVAIWLIAFVWLYWVALVVLHLIPDNGVRFSLDNLFFGFTKGPISSLIEGIELYTTGPIVCCVLIIYIVIGISMLVKRRKYAKDNLHIKSDRHEIRILTQAVIMFSSVFAIVLTWHLGDYFLPSSVWSGRGVYISYLLRAGLTPFMSLLFNRRFRQAALGILQRQEETSIAALKRTSVHGTTAR